MSSSSRPAKLQSGLDRADRLKRELSEFATAASSLKKEYERQQKFFFESSAPDEMERESLLDWFLFDWLDDLGQGVIDHFLAVQPDRPAQDREMLEAWKDSINSIFEIRSLAKNTLTLFELDSNDIFLVTTVTVLEQTPFQRGQCIGARLLPFGERFVFSGLQCIMPDREAATEALDMRRRLEALMSPEALDKVQREQCTAFCEFFGHDELTVTPDELASALGRFQHYVFEERRNPATGMTRNEEFKSQFGRDFQVPQMPPLPKGLLLSGEVTILCDEFDGLVLLPDYNRFREVFETTGRETPSAGWQEIVWRYIKDPEIPIVAFERVAETHPRRVEKVFRELLSDKRFSLDHIYAVLLHYKEPVEGIEDLQDDKILWDFFDGTTRNASKVAKKTASRKPAPKAKQAVSRAGKAKAKKAAIRPERAPARKAKAVTTRARSGAKTNRGAKKAAAKKSTQKKPAGRAAGARRKVGPAAGTRSKARRTSSAKTR